MIIKKVPIDPERAAYKSKATNIGDLVEYVAAPAEVVRLARIGYHANENGVAIGSESEQPEKLLYLTARGFNTSTIKGQQAEMVALAMECKKSRYPIQHWVVSWQEGEQPSPGQIDEALEVFLAQLGLETHQVIAALHQNTANLHLHVMINKVHPVTCKVIKPAKGWDIEAAHRTVAIIEHRQGWHREPNGRYVVLENGTVAKNGALDSAPRVPTRAADMENRSGEKSAARIAIEEAGELIRAAANWAELHQVLAGRGMRYEKVGGGAHIYVGEQQVKASTAGHWCSLGKLTKRLGAFQPSAERVVPAARKPEPLRPDMQGWDDYIAARNDRNAERRRKFKEAKARHEREMDEFREQRARHNAEIASRNWRGKGELLNAIRSVAAAESRKAELDIKQRHANERKALRDTYLQWPDYHDWLARWFRSDDASDYRYHRHEPLRLEGDGDNEVLPRDLRAFVGEVIGNVVEYRRHMETEGMSPVCFTDHGCRIDVQEANDEAAALAALQLGAAKWGRVTVFGSNTYKAMCVRLAVENGIRIANSELQMQVEAAVEARQKALRESQGTPQTHLFAAYHAAVRADRYTVTAIKMTTDHRKAFVLGGKNGLEASEIERRMHELLRLQKRGENLYFTPRSERMHHVLLDDLSDASLRRMRTDGYSPAVVLESSPGKFQAILNVPKLGAPYDKDVGNRLVEYLNREYGDPKLSGCIHPHRAPGFENRKWESGAPTPKYQQADGNFPIVTLRHAEACVCDRAIAMSRVIARRLDEEALAAREQRPLLTSGSHLSSNTVYEAHHQDILLNLKDESIDYSRIDAMIAERMRLTGHSQSDIQAIMEVCAPAIRPVPQRRDWAAYANRTAAYAFSAKADRQLERIERYRDRFLRLEGRISADQLVCNDLQMDC